MSRLRVALTAGCLALVLGVQCAGPASAHPPSIVNEAGEKAIGEEIQAFRKSVADAISAKDVAKLRDMYHPGFTHTHTSGKTDNRDARIVTALSGDPVVEAASVDDLVIRAPNDWVAVATGTSPIKSLADGKTYAVKWLQVYTRAERSWVLVASQATRAGEIKP